MSATKKKIKILIADDHPVVRKGLWSCLSGKTNFKIVGEASDGADAIQKVKELAPDVVLMDIDMPQKDGLEVTHVLRKESPNVKVLILSMQSNRDTVLRIIKAGARGYVLKDAPTDELARAIEDHGHKDVTLVKDLKAVPAWLKERAREGDLVITMGAGNVYKAGEEFAKSLAG